MKNLENFNVQQLSNNEVVKINGGETGWYYIGRAGKWIANVASDYANYTANQSLTGSYKL